MISRRDLIIAAVMVMSATLGRPLYAAAETRERIQKVGILMLVQRNEEGLSRLSAFRQALEMSGWAEGRNIETEDRWAAGDIARARDYAAESVRLKPDVILANGSGSVAALRGETSAISIVFVQLPDPVAIGFIANLARPGGNITGFTH